MHARTHTTHAFWPWIAIYNHTIHVTQMAISRKLQHIYFSTWTSNTLWASILIIKSAEIIRSILHVNKLKCRYGGYSIYKTSERVQPSGLITWAFNCVVELYIRLLYCSWQLGLTCNKHVSFQLRTRKNEHREFTLLIKDTLNSRLLGFIYRATIQSKVPNWLLLYTHLLCIQYEMKIYLLDDKKDHSIIHKTGTAMLSFVTFQWNLNFYVE